MKSKSYYEFHEQAYQDIQKNGYCGWGNKKSIEELGDEKTFLFLKKKIADFFPVIQPLTSGTRMELNALDLGSGTGTSAFLLAQLGFNVTGVDISPTAIAMAQGLALQQNLKIDFCVSDILNLEEKLNKKFDLIYDSHCLHCIVFENDRKQALKEIKKSLKLSGKFFLDTMILNDNTIDSFKTGSPLYFDKDYILWHKTNDSKVYGVKNINGELWCAQRRIYPCATVLQEVALAGFNILSQEIDPQDNEMCDMLRLVLV